MRQDVRVFAAHREHRCDVQAKARKHCSNADPAGKIASQRGGPKRVNNSEPERSPRSAQEQNRRPGH